MVQRQIQIFSGKYSKYCLKTLTSTPFVAPSPPFYCKVIEFPGCHFIMTAPLPNLRLFLKLPNPCYFNSPLQLTAEEYKSLLTTWHVNVVCSSTSPDLSLLLLLRRMASRLGMFHSQLHGLGRLE